MYEYCLTVDISGWRNINWLWESKLEEECEREEKRMYAQVHVQYAYT
jgi:hypothetical protein